MPDTNAGQAPASWRIILAFLLDFITAFFVFGFLVGKLSGGITPDGFQLQGFAAVVFFGLIIAYYVVCNRFFGGTLWKYILKARRQD